MMVVKYWNELAVSAFMTLSVNIFEKNVGTSLDKGSLPSHNKFPFLIEHISPQFSVFPTFISHIIINLVCVARLPKLPLRFLWARCGHRFPLLAVIKFSVLAKGIMF